MGSSHTRIGLFLFGIYLVLYSGFVLLNAFSPSIMESTPMFGLNLAILYGFGLILVALLLSAIYGWLARGTGANTVDSAAREPSPAGEGESK